MRREDALYQCLENQYYPVYKIQAPQNTSTPYAVFYVVNDSKINCADGMDASYEDVRFTINIYDSDLVALQIKRDDILTKLNGCIDFSAFIYQTLEDMPDGKVYRSIIDFKLNRSIVV